MVVEDLKAEEWLDQVQGGARVKRTKKSRASEGKRTKTKKDKKEKTRKAVIRHKI